MDRDADLAIVRRAYAKQILAMAGVTDPRLSEAFAQVRREDFLGPGPWRILRPFGGYGVTPDDDPVYLYTNQLVGIAPERGINNGQPSLHAILLAAAEVNEGAHVVHVGAGTGYYSAILAVLAGPEGRVTAIECDRQLAARARECLAGFPNVVVVHGNGATSAFDTADVIYVNAGVTHPTDAWLDGLADRGRLLLPLTTNENFPAARAGFSDPSTIMQPKGKIMRTGLYFLIRRRESVFEARALCPVGMVPAEGARSAVAEAALAAALDKGGWQTVTRLARGESLPEDKCWLRGDGWCLARD
jgi:protein-L-isoaspartate(D-aspartate) O-methyltransferase